MKRECLLLLFILITLSLSSHSYPPEVEVKFKHLTVQEGLSYNSVFCIIQDKKGFMWFGTQEGLNRYNGYTFDQYTASPSDPHRLSSDEIKALFEDGQ
ncbi:MAG: hypothetical protein JSV88_19255, partial [Candidatus Aminicenantes bacterium]